MKKSNFKKAAVITICCTIVSSNIAFAAPQNLTIGDIDNKTFLVADNILFENDIIIRANENVGIKLNGEFLQLIGNLYIESGRTMVPLSEIIDKLGAKAEINSQDGVINILAENIKIELKIGENTAKIIRNINGESKEETQKLDVAAKKFDDSTYVPVRFIVEALGGKVDWDTSSRTVSIDMKSDDIITVERPITFNEIGEQTIMDSNLLSSWYQKNYKTKGIYSAVDGEWMYVLVSAGEKNTGGYSLQIDSITEVAPGTAYVHAALESPDKDSIVTQALTYPNCVVKFKKGDIEKLQWDLSEKTLDSIVCQNTDYGFTFSLPESWLNYSIIEGQWKGTYFGDAVNENNDESGLQINIRHPQWTAENPRQDIPIMIFTIKQWDLIQNDKIGVSAAPIQPKELGRNSSYVFALPARYNYAFPIGYEEVEDILENNPLQTFEINK